MTLYELVGFECLLFLIFEASLKIFTNTNEASPTKHRMKFSEIFYFLVNEKMKKNLLSGTEWNDGRNEDETDC